MVLPGCRLTKHASRQKRELVLKRSITAGSRSSEAYEHLAGVTAAKQVDEGAGSMVDAVDDGLGVDDRAVAQPGADVGDHVGLAIGVIDDDEAAQGEPLAPAGARFYPDRTTKEGRR